MENYKQISLSDRLLEYIRTISLRESSVLAALRKETNKLRQRNMQVSPEEGQLLQLLATICNAKRAIELGVFTGYSSICIAQALPDDGLLIACDTSKEWTDIAKQYWERALVDKRIQLRLKPAVNTLNELLAEFGNNSFDFVFIDADKKNYDQYYELSLQLLRPRGLIVVDNTLWSGHVADKNNQDPETEALRALNKKLSSDKRIRLSLLPYADGLTLISKN